MPRQYPPDLMAFARLLNTNRRQRRHESLPTLTRLLKTDSKLEFASIRDVLSCAGKPRDAVQEVYVQEVIYFVWEFLHLQRCRAAIFKSERRPALEELLRALHFSELGFELVPRSNEARNFVRGLPGCYLARGPDADRHGKLLINLALEGSRFSADSQWARHERSRRNDRRTTSSRSARSCIIGLSIIARKVRAALTRSSAFFHTARTASSNIGSGI